MSDNNFIRLQITVGLFTLVVCALAFVPDVVAGRWAQVTLEVLSAAWIVVIWPRH